MIKTILIFALLSSVVFGQSSMVNGKGGGITDPTAFKTALALENVGNTSDADKPVSTATQTALDLKAAIDSVQLSSFTAANDRTYTTVATLTVTDPAPVEGKGFIVVVRNGTATVGGTAYATAGTVIRRSFHSGAWANYAYQDSAAYVTLTGNQTIAGEKMFSDTLLGGVIKARSGASVDIQNAVGDSLLRVGVDHTGTGGRNTGVAEGVSTTASGDSSHAEGYSTTASGNFSHAELYKSEATGLVSHAGGAQAKAIHNGTFVRTDSETADFESIQANECAMRFANGYRLTGGDLTAPNVSGTNTGDETVSSLTTLIDSNPDAIRNSLSVPSLQGFGFVDPSTVSITYTNTGNDVTLTVAPISPATTFTVYAGPVAKTHTFTGAQTKTISASSTNYFFYYENVGGVMTLQSSTSPWVIGQHAPISYLTWDSFAQSGVFKLWELHSTAMDDATHAYNHTTSGAKYVINSGLDMIHNATTGTPASSGLNTMIGITAGSFRDEDIQVTTVNGTSGTVKWEQDHGPQTIGAVALANGGQFPVMYYNGARAVRSVTNGRFPFLFTSNIPDYVNASGAITPVTEDRRFGYWLIVTSDIDDPIRLVPHRAVYTSLAAAQAGMALTALPADLQGIQATEVLCAYRLIFRYNASGGGSSGSTAIKNTQLENATDFRAAQVALITGTAPNNASAVIVTPSGNIESTNVQSALEELDSEKATSTQGEIADERLAWTRLWRWRKKLEVSGYAPRIALMGDSMIGMPITKMRQHIWKLFGQGGVIFVEPSGSGGATTLTTAYTTWYNGYAVRLSNTGHTATIGLNGGNSGVAGDKMKLYYVTKPGGGTFKVQSTEDGTTWTDEVGYTAVSSDGTLAGSIIDLAAKTTIRKVRRLRAVWVSGGEVDIIGGAIYDTRSYGAMVALLAPQSNDLADNITASTAIMNPIFADIGVDLFVYSHFDGGQANWAANQETWQNMVNTASATTPTWLVIGPPAGEDDAQDVFNAAQAAAQKTIAESRGDAFWDNRRWAGTPTQANAWGLQIDGDIHYEELAQWQWIVQCFEDVGVAMSITGFPAANESLALKYAPQIRRSRNWVGGTIDELEILGTLRLCNPPGLTGIGMLRLEDINGATSYQDIGSVSYETNTLWLASQGSKTFGFHLGGGYGPYTYVNGSTASAPLGQIGLTANPILELNVGKTIQAAGATGNVTIDKTSGRVRFAAAAQELTVTCRHATSNSVIMATVLGDDATATDVRVKSTTAGSFILKLNAAATAETAVSWWLIP